MRSPPAGAAVGPRSTIRGFTRRERRADIQCPEWLWVPGMMEGGEVGAAAGGTAWSVAAGAGPGEGVAAAGSGWACGVAGVARLTVMRCSVVLKGPATGAPSRPMSWRPMVCGPSGRFSM
ncbi:MAG: hypothetical protein IPN17_15625 [Deltaproteobacteria bacterium]|nr:hypothetical protein [Deltaproteobacteria bacterium]